jgi:hypothetical protein
MRLLLPNGRRTSGRQIEELSLQGSLALNVVDHLRNPPPVLLGREMRPAGEGLEMHRVRGRELQALESFTLSPGAMLPGAVEAERVAFVCQPLRCTGRQPRLRACRAVSFKGVRRH